MRSPIRGTAAVALAVAAALLLGACGRGFSDAAPEQVPGPATLRMLITSNGPEDLKVVQDAADAWAQRTGGSVDVQVASDLGQQLSQGFAGGNPPDVFMVDASKIQDYAANGNLFPYGESVPYKDDIVPTLAQTFTVGGALQCVPKDSSNLGLVINTDMWARAGLTEADVPRTWEQLAAVAQRLTTGGVTGLTFDANRDRVGAFMAQDGGWFTNDDQTRMTTDSPQNLRALQYVRDLLASGALRYPEQIDSGWGGEAMGKGRAAMTIEGNWFKGSARTDYPGLRYEVHELPAGPDGKATLSFTNCWGVAAASRYQAQAVDLVNSLMTPERQMEFSRAFGVMPSLSSLAEDYRRATPEDAGWLAGNAYARGPVNARGMESVMKDFDTKLQALPGADPAAILAATQSNGDAAIEANR